MERLPHAQRSVTISTLSPTSTIPCTRIVHFVVGRKAEVAKFQSNTPDDQIKELFRCAAEAGVSDILKLYDIDGHLLNLSADLPSNTPRTRYTLEVVAAHTNGMLLEEVFTASSTSTLTTFNSTKGHATTTSVVNGHNVGVDLAALEERVSQLEKQLRTECDVLPPALQELKQQVDGFRTKLETTEHLSWLGFYKQLPEPVSTEECRRLKYRRTSDSVKKRVKERYYQICDTEVSERVRQWIRMPTFDCRPWEDEEVLLLLQQMFLDLGLCSRFGIELKTLKTFIFEVYKNYNDVPFHNFRHCFCVAQMMYTIIWATNLQQKIGDLEILILLVSCVCHDLDHPGYNNIYQINAKTELAIRYNDISPLENHHCSVAFRILENDDCNIFKTFSQETFKHVREGMIRCILATDMARHNEILAQFKEITPEFDYSNKSHLNLLTMVLIKVADISNEARPMDVAEPWLDRLLTEFFKQSDAEKLEGLPVTPFMDREKITKPSSQCSFIGFVLLPLFEALGELLTELQELIVQPVRDALDYYRRLNEATKEERLHRKSVVAELLEHPALARSSVGAPPHSHHFLQHPNSPDESSGSDTVNVPKSVSNHSVKSRKSISFRSRSRSTDEEYDQSNDNTAYSDDEQNLADVIEDNESSDSETATEVEVSEKTLKFKISTESSVANTGRKSYPGSRKGSREKTQSLTCSEVARAVQRDKERGKFTGALSFDSRSTSKRLSMDMNESIELLRKYHGRSFDRTGGGGRYSSDISSPTSEKSVDFHENNEIKLKPICVSPPARKLISPKIEINEPMTYQQATEQIYCNNINNNTNKSDNSVKSSVDECYNFNNKRTTKNSIKIKTIPQSKSKTNFDEIQILERTLNKGEYLHSPQIEHKPESLKLVNNNRSFLSRLRQFTDKFTLSIDSSSKTQSSPSSSSIPPPKSPRHHHHDVISNCCSKSSDVDYENDKKASTLPKINKQKGWRTILSSEKVNSLTNIPINKLDNQQSPSTSGLQSSTSTSTQELISKKHDQKNRISSGQGNKISLIQHIKDTSDVDIVDTKVHI